MPPTRHAPLARVDYEDLSSPDPLASDLIDDQPSQRSSRTRSAGTTITNRHRLPAPHHKKSSSIDISPSKTIAEQNLSPWRIRVTVEAEPGDEEMAQVVGGRTHTVTSTIKVPLRDEDASSSPTKGRKAASGIRRRGSGTRRSVSPARKRHSVTDLGIVVLGDDEEEDEWRVKSRSPRRRRGSKGQGSGKSTPAVRRVGTDVFAVREDEGVDDRIQREDSGVEDNDESGSPELRQVDLNEVAMRARSNATKAENMLGAGNATAKARRTVSTNSAMSYPTPSPTASERGYSDDRVQEEVREGREIGYDTIMESEGFTMIDLESLPSVRQLRNSPDAAQGNSTPEQEKEPNTSTAADDDPAEATSDAPMIEESTAGTEDTEHSEQLPSSPPPDSKNSKGKIYSVGQLQLPSSLKVHRHRHVTPLPPMQSSPHLPSPPPPPRSTTTDKTLPVNSRKATRAAMALQDAVTPEQSFSGENENAEQAEAIAEEAVFGGFSSGTRRELRADLRFGEELGKRQVGKVREEGERLVRSADKTLTPDQPQIWRVETSTQHARPPVPALQHQASNDSTAWLVGRSEAAQVLSNEERWEQYWQKEREEVIKQANEASDSKVIVIDSDHEDDSHDEDANTDAENDETDGDIWLAEAKNASSSPREPATKPTQLETRVEPRRKLIPSPWKRGEQIDAHTTSHVSGDESMSGLLWRQDGNASGARFGDEVVSHPERLAQTPSRFDRRRSGIFDAEQKTIQQHHGISELISPDDEDDVEADEALHWRSAEDVVEEETTMLEAEKEQQSHLDAPTNLYETNLEGLPEQDLASSPHVQSLEKHEQEPSVSEDDVEAYRQRTSLSPSKQRSFTPRSAMKGGRASFSVALKFDVNGEDAEKRKVVWAKRSSCVNEMWEESSRSIRSVHESTMDETPTPVASEKMVRVEPVQVRDDIQAEESDTDEMHDAPRQTQQTQAQNGKGWLGGFFSKSGGTEQQHSNGASPTRQPRQPAILARPVSNFDGLSEPGRKTNTKADDEDVDDTDNEDGSYVPTSRHALPEFDAASTNRRGNSGPPTHRSKSVPSYLKSPSYPTIPDRDTTKPLATGGDFTTTHFRTLHIIYRKSQRPRFRGPAYPEEVRPDLRRLIQEQWKLVVDETESMGEKFTFRIGVAHIRVLERFMREVEHDHSQQSVYEIEWDWTAEELAEKLGRIVVGEVVREEEKAAQA